MALAFRTRIYMYIRLLVLIVIIFKCNDTSSIAEAYVNMFDLTPY